MSSTTGNDESAAAPRKVTPSLQKLEVKKTAPIYYESGSVRDGKNWERWIILAQGNIFQITKNAGEAGWSRLQSDSFGGDVSNYAAADFEEFKWIDKTNYKGVEMLEGERPAYLFELTTSAPISRAEELNFDHGAAQMAKEAGLSYNLRTIRAWIDPKTKLPIKLDKGTEVKDYVFGPAPAARLVPPPGVIAVLQSWLADLKKTRR